MSLNRAKSANLQTKHIVFGFIRKHEQTTFIAAPELVKYMILNYYLLRETFDTKDKGPAFELSSDCTIVTFDPKKTDPNHTPDMAVFGVTPILDLSEGVAEYQWTLKITHFEEKSCFGIAIGPRGKSSKETDVRSSRWNMRCPGIFGLYFVGSSCHSIINDGTGISLRDRVIGMHPYRPKQGDIIKVTLDKAKDVIKFHVNGEYWECILRQKNPKEKERKHYLTIFGTSNRSEKRSARFHLIDFSTTHFWCPSSKWIYE